MSVHIHAPSRVPNRCPRFGAPQDGTHITPPYIAGGLSCLVQDPVSKCPAVMAYKGH